MENKEMYNAFCDRMDQINKEYNPCQFEDGKCIASREGTLDYDSCCRKCRHLEKTHGCKERILGCKFWYCGIASMSIPGIIRAEIESMRFEAIMNGFHLIFGLEQK